MFNNLSHIPVAALCCSIFCGTLQAAEQVAAADLLKSVRHQASLQNKKVLKGTLRKAGNKTPFQIKLNQNVIEYQYVAGAGWDTFGLELDADGQKLYRINAGKRQTLKDDQMNQTLANTDVSYEDLSLRFLYWPNAQYMPHSHNSFIKGRECHIVAVSNPGVGGDYSWVRVWIDKENGAMWQMEGVTQDGRIVKRFLLNSIMKLKDGTWYMRQMRVEKHNPQSKRIESVSYIELDNQ